MQAMISFFCFLGGSARAGVAADAEWDTAPPPAAAFTPEPAAAAGGADWDAAPAPAAGGDWDAAPAAVAQPAPVYADPAHAAPQQF